MALAVNEAVPSSPIAWPMRPCAVRSAVAAEAALKTRAKPMPWTMRIA
jgi:hypothetical protein